VPPGSRTMKCTLGPLPALAKIPGC
jgi:hypothetical protein